MSLELGYKGRPLMMFVVFCLLCFAVRALDMPYDLVLSSGFMN